MDEKPLNYVVPSPQHQLPNKHSHRIGQNSKIADILSTLCIVGAALGLALCLIAFVFQSYQVDGPSMESTLQNNDRLIVWKVPRTLASITGHQYVPNRGDIIIFNQDNLAEFGQSNVKQLVKRVIGLPGDRVVVSDGHITIYNTQHPNGFNPDTTLEYGKKHPLPYTAGPNGDIDITLAKDQIFVCGDNRTDSLDSRSFGPVGLNAVIGKLVFRMYPFNAVQIF